MPEPTLDDAQRQAELRRAIAAIQETERRRREPRARPLPWVL